MSPMNTLYLYLISLTLMFYPFASYIFFTRGNKVEKKIHNLRLEIKEVKLSNYLSTFKYKIIPSYDLSCTNIELKLISWDRFDYSFDSYEDAALCLQSMNFSSCFIYGGRVACLTDKISKSRKMHYAAVFIAGFFLMIINLLISKYLINY